MAIQITEIAPPRKMSGRSSFLVQFNYRPDIVAALKSLPTYTYNKQDQSWEIPASSLSQLLDTLTFIDDIELRLLKEFTNINSNLNQLSEVEINNFQIKPFQHQIDGINYGLTHNKWLLLDNPGCGKSAQIIYLAETLKAREKIEHCLIIAGINSLKGNWAKEIKLFSKESALIIGQKKLKNGTISKTPMTISERVLQLSSKISEFFVIINVESLRDSSIIKAILKGPNKFGMIAIDECHKCLGTGKSSQQGSNILKLTADYKVAATGSLLLNNPLNCWGALVWTDNDYSTMTNFKSQYCNFGGFNNAQILGYKNLDLLKDELESCSLRRKKEDLMDLPPKLVTYELLDMNPDHAKFYESVKAGVKEEVDKVQLNSSNLLALTTRLRQATVDPGILTTQAISSTKLDRCVEIIEDLISQNEKVVVMSQFKPPIYKLATVLAAYSPLVNTGDTPDIEVQANIEKFQTDSSYKIFLGSAAKISTGLTLNAASYLIMLDEHWTYAMNDQAQNRIYRVNNTSSANIIVLACKDTIDEQVHKISETKKDLSEFVIDNVENQFSDSLQSEMKDILLSL